MYVLVSDKYYIGQDNAKVGRLVNVQSQAIEFKTQQSAVNYYKTCNKILLKDFTWSILNLDDNSIITIDEYYKMKKLSIGNIETELPVYDLGKVIDYVCTLVDIKKNGDIKKSIISSKISEIDKSISDIIHYVEHGLYDESNAFDLLNQLKNLRIARRSLKNTQMSIDCASKLKLSDTEIENLKKVKDGVYNAREIDESCIFFNPNCNKTCDNEKGNVENVQEAV